VINPLEFAPEPKELPESIFIYTDRNAMFTGCSTEA
jgi:hypothetical protein